ncbi:MAG: recombinase family protein [Clostridia bacterium]|nr:recombinase family protein [Clostridia bacterium]
MEDFEKRVCAYCRVSTDKDDQINSFESQVRFFEDYIDHREGWRLCGIYSDEGITGTSTRRRNGFNKMILAAESGEIDLIVTKEISRFARNTLDSIYYTRELRRMGVGVIFLADGINTLDSDSELRLTIMASVAQEESRKTSERVKWGQRRQMERGVVFGREPMGYTLRDGILSVDHERAKTVRQIFLWYTEENKGTYTIARLLNEMGVRPPGKAEQWKSAAVARILKNEKYCGDLIQQKTYTPDYLTHDKKINHGEIGLVELRDHHEGIVSREIFIKAQERLSRNGSIGYSGRFALSGKVKCGICGANYTSKLKSNKSGDYRLWRCSRGCGNKSIRDSLLRREAERVICELDMTSVISGVIETVNRYAVNISRSDICEVLFPPLSDDILRCAVEYITVKNGVACVRLWE